MAFFRAAANNFVKLFQQREPVPLPSPVTESELLDARKRIAHMTKAIEHLEGIEPLDINSQAGSAKNRNLPSSKIGAALAVSTIVEAWRCVNIRRQRIGSLQWEIRRVADDSVYETSKNPYPKHPLAVAIQRSAREYDQNLFGRWEYFKCMTGENYVEIVPDIYGRDAGLKVLSSLYTNPIAPAGEITGYQYEGAKSTIILAEYQVVMDVYEHPFSEFVGQAPMEVALGVANIIRNYERQINAHYINNGTVGLVASPKFSEDALEDDETKAVNKLLREQVEGVENTSSTLVAPIPMDIEAHETQDISKNVPLSDSMIARIFSVFGIARSLAGDFDETRYKSSEETEDVVNRVTIIPEADDIAAVMNSEIMPRFDSSGLYYFGFNYEQFNRLSSDKTKRIDAGVRYYQGGLGTLNEARAIAQEGALEEGGDEFYQAPAAPAFGAALQPMNQGQQVASETAVNQLLSSVVDKLDESMRLNRLAVETNYRSLKHFNKADDFSQSVMIGVFLTPAIAQELLAASASLSSPAPAESLHITLGYLGKTTDDIDFALLARTLSEISPELPQARALIKGVGRMVKRDADNAIYARIESNELDWLQNSLSHKLLEKAGIVLSAYTSFIPHITLGYVRADEASPLIELREQELVFDTLTLAIGEAQYHYTLGKKQRNLDSEQESDEQDESSEDATDVEPSATAATSDSDATDATSDKHRAKRTATRKHNHDASHFHEHDDLELSESVRAQINELDTWRRSARRDDEPAKSYLRDFACKHLPIEIQASVKDALEGARAAIEKLDDRETRRAFIDHIFKSAEIDCLIVETYPAYLSKSVASYRNRMREFGRGFWSGLMDSSRYVEGVNSAVDSEYRNAFKQGLAKEGIVWEDLSDAEKSILEDKIADEQQYVAGLAQYISENSRANKGKLASVLQRVELWATRYDSVYDLGLLVGARDKKKKWVYNAAKEHCIDCEHLNGLVYRASTWLRYQVIPRSAKLACFGLYCGCEFVDTSEPVRRGKPPALVGRNRTRRRRR